MDVIAPLVHEFTCQAMASDLLPITVGVYEDKTVVLTTSSAISLADGSTAAVHLFSGGLSAHPLLLYLSPFDV
jgi:hypothetical protein